MKSLFFKRGGWINSFSSHFIRN